MVKLVPGPGTGAACATGPVPNSSAPATAEAPAAPATAPRSDRAEIIFARLLPDLMPTKENVSQKFPGKQRSYTVIVL
ncbi:hypothetical protein [Mycobacterium seoulense]|uniref:hypothetical protein n=1 Tax=Mycobacterium seoulense TaxID=386911 RepID=UPI003CEED738